MKILIAADGSAYTKRMLAFIAAHDEWLGRRHTHAVLHCVPAIAHRAAAVANAGASMWTGDRSSTHGGQT